MNIPWLNKQIKLIEPIVIILVGSTALEVVLETRERITTVRGTWQNCDGRLFMPIFHPAYLLRNPSRKDGSPISLTLSDLLKVRKALQRIDL